ncbi:hypothetical protein SAMN05660652_03829 [Propionivibrio dicarboxylicus]|uniref:Uncharacterized protein n=2 Tax=Propionivibrio dicarboxylicus TaxID=83767 RepID=A0A1G8MFR8_9RHOO|nr:hypothetical protein SAMN05660652_03829 [Propionivibrio dicarboxylicus]
MNTVAPATLPAGGNYIIVSQVESNRVVYFTDNPEYRPPMNGRWYWVGTYVGILPSAMTLRNCWAWRFNGQVFSGTAEEPVPALETSSLDGEKASLLRALSEKIESVRAPFMPSCLFGELARREKLKEARDYLARAKGRVPEEEKFELLEAVAVARGCAMWQAARLIVIKAEETERVVKESERFREKMNQAIAAAGNQATLLELRERLLEASFPGLSTRFESDADRMEPVNHQGVLGEVHRRHEMSRLKAQLRETINRKRRLNHSDYIGNDELVRHKALLARSLLENGGKPREREDYSILESYAVARGLPLAKAAVLLASAVGANWERLTSTERIKDTILARIDAITTLGDIDDIEEMIAVI